MCHTVAQQCYIFCLTHLEDITEFYLAEAAAGLSMPDSAKKLLDLCNTAEKVTELYTQLHEYVEVLSATACYMNYVCEYSSGRPVVHAIWNKEESLVQGFKIVIAANQGLWKLIE